MTLLDQLRERRATARTAAEAVLTRSAETGEPMTADDLAEHSRAVADEREAADAIEAWHSDQLADIRASIARTPGAAGAPAGDVLSREQSVADWCRTRGHSGFDEPVSFSRYLKGLATGDWSGADHERALSEGTLTAGGHLVPTPLSARVIDLARNKIHVDEIAYRLRTLYLLGRHAVAYRNGDYLALAWTGMLTHGTPRTERAAWATFCELINPALSVFHTRVRVEYADGYNQGDSVPSVLEVGALQLVNDLARQVDYLTCPRCGVVFARQVGGSTTTHAAPASRTARPPAPPQRESRHTGPASGRRGQLMASVEKRIRNGQVRWYARYRDPSGAQRTKSFDRRAAAERYLTGIEGAKLTGTYVDPTRSRVTIGAWADLWIDAQAGLSPTTRNRYEGIIRTHIRPRWESVRLSDVSHAEVQRWVTGLDVAPASVRKVHRVLSMMLAWAVADDRLARNPAERISLPRVAQAEKRFLTHRQVHELADACGPEYRLMVLFLAYTGLRWGEMAALKVGRVDFLRRRVLVAESVTPVKGAMTWGETKGHEHREVPIPRFLVEDLAQHVAGRPADALLFEGTRGAVMRSQTFQRAALTQAAAGLGIPASTRTSCGTARRRSRSPSGADVKVVQQMLGHKSATMTLDLYGHLFGDRLDVVADAMDAARTAALSDVYPACTGGEVVALRPEAI